MRNQLHYTVASGWLWLYATRSRIMGYLIAAFFTFQVLLGWYVIFRPEHGRVVALLAAPAKAARDLLTNATSDSAK